MNLLKHLKRPKVRASVESALEVSAAVPNSGLTFVDNSRGSAAAIAEFSKLLDVAIENFDYEGEPSDRLQLQLQRLYKEAARYSNNSLKPNLPSDNWNCSRSEAEIVSIAFACATAVYDPEARPCVPGFTIDEEKIQTSSIGGTTKAASFVLVSRSLHFQPEPNPLLPMLVVSVKGTKSIVDCMVNLNGTTKDIATLLDIKDLHSSDAATRLVEAHAGFQNGTEALVPAVSKQINSIVEKHAVRHVLFTGHSAGGAVSSLLFAKYLVSAPKHYPSLKFSSITFGAPPVSKPNLTPFFTNSPELSVHRGLMLSIVNEYDIVPRADGAYIRSLVDLYRSIYDLPPVQDNDVPDSAAVFHLPRFSFGGDAENIDDTTKNWPLPKPLYWHIGEIVALKVMLTEKSSGTNNSSVEDDEIVLSAIVVKPEKFAKLLACNVAIHRRVRYGERINMLRDGKFNGLDGWV